MLSFPFRYIYFSRMLAVVNITDLPSTHWCYKTWLRVNIYPGVNHLALPSSNGGNFTTSIPKIVGVRYVKNVQNILQNRQNTASTPNNVKKAGWWWYHTKSKMNKEFSSRTSGLTLNCCYSVLRSQLPIIFFIYTSLFPRGRSLSGIKCSISSLKMQNYLAAKFHQDCHKSLAVKR